MENKRGRKWARDEETGRCASKKVEKKKRTLASLLEATGS
jgi:hypothetical protein